MPVDGTNAAAARVLNVTNAEPKDPRNELVQKFVEALKALDQHPQRDEIVDNLGPFKFLSEDPVYLSGQGARVRAANLTTKNSDGDFSQVELFAIQLHEGALSLRVETYYDSPAYYKLDAISDSPFVTANSAKELDAVFAALLNQIADEF